MKKLVSHSVLFVTLLSPVAIFGMSMNTKFSYRPDSNVDGTRYDRNCLTTVELNLSGGRAKKSYNGDKNCADVLHLYGLNDIAKMGLNALGDPAASIYNADLHDVIVRGGAGLANGLGVNYAGKFTMFEGNLYLAQNLCKGFFLEANLPFKRLEVKDLVMSDGSVAAEISVIPGLTAPWERVKSELTELLALYNLSDGEASRTGVGDMGINVGWTHNNDDIENLDFLDTTIRVGLSAPTAKKRNEDKAFEIALGYDGHFGLGTSFDMAFGIYDWVSFGTHIGGLFFFKKTKEMRMNTTTGQNGFFKLLKGNAKRDMGNIWDVGAFLKADHIFKGFSMTFGYDYVHKDKDTLTPENTTIFPTTAANADVQLAGFSAHNITLALEYDMAKAGCYYNPYVRVFYSRPVKGKYIFKTDVGGGAVGLNLTWDF